MALLFHLLVHACTSQGGGGLGIRSLLPTNPRASCCAREPRTGGRSFGSLPRGDWQGLCACLAEWRLWVDPVVRSIVLQDYGRHNWMTDRDRSKLSGLESSLSKGFIQLHWFSNGDNSGIAPGASGPPMRSRCIQQLLLHGFISYYLLGVCRRQELPTTRASITHLEAWTFVTHNTGRLLNRHGKKEKGTSFPWRKRDRVFACLPEFLFYFFSFSPWRWLIFLSDPYHPPAVSVSFPQQVSGTRRLHCGLYAPPTKSIARSSATSICSTGE